MGDQVIAKYTRLNEQIRAPRLRVIDSDGKQLGILSKQEALAIAQERELDLVEISPDADPPVCKIVDWGKYNYQRTKQLQKNRKSAKTLDMKQMRFGLKIGAHDLAIKMGKVSKFLEAGHTMNEPHGCFAEYTSKGPYVNVLLDRQRTVFEKFVFPVTFRGTFEIILDLTSSNMFSRLHLP